MLCVCVVSGWVGYLRADDPRGKDAVGRAKLYFAACRLSPNDCVSLLI